MRFALDKEVVHSRIRLFALVLFMVSLPFGSIVLNNIPIFLLAANWFFESPLKLKWHRIKQNYLFFVFIQFFLVYAVGLLYSENTGRGFFEIEKKLNLLFFPLILASSNPLSKTDIRIFFKSFIIFTCLAALVCISYAVYLNYEEGYTLSFLYDALVLKKRYPGSYNFFNYWYFTYELFAKPIHMHPVYFAMYLVFSLCISVWLWWNTQDKYKSRKRLVLFLMVFNFLVVVLLASRTQVFILLLLGTAFVLYQSFIRKQLLKGVFFLLLVYGMGLAFVLLNPVTRERFIDSNRPGAHFSDNKYGEGGLSLRLYKWKYTLETIAEHPFLGTGTGDSQDKLQETYKKHDFKIGYDLRFNAHNQFLQTMLELGVFGFISLCICLLVPAVLAYRKKEWIYLAFLTVFSISCLTESMMEVNKGITFYAFFNSLFAFHFLNKQEE